MTTEKCPFPRQLNNIDPDKSSPGCNQIISKYNFKFATVIGCSQTWPNFLFSVYLWNKYCTFRAIAQTLGPYLIVHYCFTLASLLHSILKVGRAYWQGGELKRDKKYKGVKLVSFTFR